MESKKNCLECGKSNVDDAYFCEYCGSKIEETAPEVPVQEQSELRYLFDDVTTYPAVD